jgi:hypothetical protein
MRVLEMAALHDRRYHASKDAPKPAIHHKSVGLTGGQCNLFVIDKIQIIHPVRATGQSEFHRAE